MREEMSDGHRLGGRPQAIGSGGAVEGFEDGELGEFGKIFFDWIFDRKTTLLDQLHGGGRGDGFGHGRNPEQRIELERASLADVCDTKRALVNDPLAIGRHNDDAGYILSLDRTAHRLVDGRRALGLLCIGNERQGCRAANKGDELAPFHRMVPPVLVPQGVYLANATAKISRRHAGLHAAPRYRGIACGNSGGIDAHVRSREFDWERADDFSKDCAPCSPPPYPPSLAGRVRRGQGGHASLCPPELASDSER